MPLVNASLPSQIGLPFAMATIRKIQQYVIIRIVFSLLPDGGDKYGSAIRHKIKSNR
jgi:hypothetical protein